MGSPLYIQTYCILTHIPAFSAHARTEGLWRAMMWNNNDDDAPADFSSLDPNARRASITSGVSARQCPPTCSFIAYTTTSTPPVLLALVATAPLSPLPQTCCLRIPLIRVNPKVFLEQTVAAFGIPGPHQPHSNPASFYGPDGSALVFVRNQPFHPGALFHHLERLAGVQGKRSVAPSRNYEARCPCASNFFALVHDGVHEHSPNPVGFTR